MECQANSYGFLKPLILFRKILAHFVARRATKPGFPGLRYRSGPASGVAASHPSNPLRGGSLRTSSLNCRGNSGAANCL
jgi:hypothetical protein